MPKTTSFSSLIWTSLVKPRTCFFMEDLWNLTLKLWSSSQFLLASSLSKVALCQSSLFRVFFSTSVTLCNEGDELFP